MEVLIEKIDKLIKEMSVKADKIEVENLRLGFFYRSRVIGLLDARALIMEELKK